MKLKVRMPSVPVIKCCFSLTLSNKWMVFRGFDKLRIIFKLSYSWKARPIVYLLLAPKPWPWYNTACLSLSITVVPGSGPKGMLDEHFYTSIWLEVKQVMPVYFYTNFFYKEKEKNYSWEMIVPVYKFGCHNLIYINYSIISQLCLRFILCPLFIWSDMTLSCGNSSLSLLTPK